MAGTAPINRVTMQTCTGPTGLFTGIDFRPQAPWITLEQDQMTRFGYVTAYRVTRNGADITDVTLELVPDATLDIQYIR